MNKNQLIKKLLKIEHNINKSKNINELQQTLTEYKNIAYAIDNL